MWDFGEDFNAKEFCDENTAKLSLAIAFMANAKILKVVPNKVLTRAIVRVKHGKKLLCVEVGIDSPYTVKERLLYKVLRKFGVPRPWTSWTWRIRCEKKMLDEMERRGATGFGRAEHAVDRLCWSKAFEEMKKNHKIQSELNRALATLKNARAAGATPRQMHKLINQIMNEEIIAEVQAS